MDTTDIIILCLVVVNTIISFLTPLISNFFQSIYSSDCFGLHMRRHTNYDNHNHNENNDDEEYERKKEYLSKVINDIKSGV